MHRLARTAGFSVALDPEDEDLLLLRKVLVRGDGVPPTGSDRSALAQPTFQTC
jgi:hypothetical protein